MNTPVICANPPPPCCSREGSANLEIKSGSCDGKYSICIVWNERQAFVFFCVVKNTSNVHCADSHHTHMTTIGDTSCFHVGFSSSNVDVFIGETSCIGESSCINICRNSQNCDEITIQSNSCTNNFACDEIGDGNGRSVTIEGNSCDSERSCSELGTFTATEISIQRGSCNAGTYAGKYKIIKTFQKVSVVFRSFSSHPISLTYILVHQQKVHAEVLV